MKYSQLQILSVILFSLLFISSCGNSASSTNNDSATMTATLKGSVNNPQGKNSQKATAAGSVTSSDEGFVVSAAKVKGDGSLEVIDNSGETTGTDGNFSITVTYDATSAQKIVLTAKRGDQTLKCFVPGRLSGGSEIKLKPISIESTGEAEVFQQVVSNGETDLISKADIEAYVGEKAAAGFINNADAKAEFATALSAEYQVRKKSLKNQSVDISDQQKENIKKAKTQALLTLHSSLYDNSSEVARADAYGNFLEALTKAYTGEGVEADVYARAKEAASQMIYKNTTESSEEARSEIRANTALQVAWVIDYAIQERMSTANASEADIQSAAEAGTKLRSDIKNETTLTKNEEDSFFQTYNAAILKILKTEFDAEAQDLAAINDDINTTAGIKVALETSIQTNFDADVIVASYSTFYAQVKQLVNKKLSSSDETQTAFITDMMVLINIAN